MGSSDSDPEENFCYYGKPLDPYDEDAFPKKKPISMEDQIATDAQGRRRFHGAFTGGFSAGFYNTVGSLEGWTPSEFKSSREEKATRFQQKPHDFMDDEDLGEHGIAYQTVKATTDYATSKKRKKQVFAEGPIPGEPVLDTLLTSGNETIGYMLLKNLGIKDKLKKKDEETSSAGKVYGCQMPIHYKISKSIDHNQYEIPAIYKEYLDNPKSNTFGLGYQGLDRSHVNLFKPSSLVVKDKNNKNFSIGGQAFGVGAFEVEDDDIYTKEDMSNYDFELTKEKSKIKQPKDRGILVFGSFKKSKKPLCIKLSFPLPTIPHSFTGKHKVKKSRFEPLEEDKVEEIARSEINPAIRAKYLGENDDKIYTESKPIIDRPSKKSEKPLSKVEPKKEFDVSTLLISDRFVAASQNEESISESVKSQDTTHGTDQMRAAVRMKMFGPLTRITTDWQPCAFLCKRFNVPEPLADRPDNITRKRTKNLIFQSQKFEDDMPALQPGIVQDATSLEGERVAVGKSETAEPNQFQPSDEACYGEKQEEKSMDKDNNVEAIPVDITDKIDVAEKTDLFKAVFLSSSESEDEKEAEVKQEKDETETFKTTLLSEPLIPKIKPLKQGILSHLNTHSFTKPGSNSTSNSENAEETKPSINILSKIEKSTLLPAVSDKKASKKIVEISSDEAEENGEDRRRERHKKKKEKHKKRDRREDYSDSEEERERQKKNKHKKKKKKDKREHKSKKKSKY